MGLVWNWYYSLIYWCAAPVPTMHWEPTGKSVLPYPHKLFHFADPKTLCCGSVSFSCFWYTNQLDLLNVFLLGYEFFPLPIFFKFITVMNANCNMCITMTGSFSLFFIFCNYKIRRGKMMQIQNKIEHTTKIMRIRLNIEVDPVKIFCQISSSYIILLY